MPKPVNSRYRTTNWSDYNASLRRRGSLSVWFDPEMPWHAGRSGRRGHPETFSDSAIQTCLTLKVLFGLPLRQTVGLVASLIEMAGLDWPAPDYSTLCRRQARIRIQNPYRCSGQPLKLLVDRTGIRFRGDGEWLARKHGATRRREWRKVHLAMDTATGDIRGVEFTSSRQGDSPILPELLSQIPANETVETVTADDAYDTRRCHAAILERGAEPIIPIRRNGRAWKPDCPAAISRNDILKATGRLGHSIWKKWGGYHARSRVEAQMNRLKLCGERIMSRDPDRQTAEIQIRIVIMNRCSALGRAAVEALA
ncbi:IS5 family transposase [Paracoccus sp. Z330]|uniref:IS5 family transposase n=1 Tax=Paracoccus onchidii TaxID=3017813 RepID=A0ABT4ZDK2_9RHOB|nr:IS5 family transposase [Paracoccus onchidii]MDB6177446.1 IS5 family transposase [Paracoccus onchidii]